MDVRTFFDEHTDLYSDVPKLTAADVPIEDLHIVRSKGEVIFAVGKNGCVFRKKRTADPARIVTVPSKLKKRDLKKKKKEPVEMTPEEKAYAREIMRIFREEDR